MRARTIARLRRLLLALLLPACTATPMPLPGSPDADRTAGDLGGYHTTPDGGPSVTLDRGVIPPKGDGASVGEIDALPKDLPDGGPADGGSDGGDGGDGSLQQELGAPLEVGPPLDALAPLDAVVPPSD